jgi:purine-nucleoside phosphorylase
MLQMKEQIKETVDFIRKKTQAKYPIGIILGTGLGGLVKYIKKDFEIDYKQIPNFPVSTVESHSGKLIFGSLSGKPVVAMQGRFHFYEGYLHQRVTYPIYIFKELGVKYLIVSNACGAINSKFHKTDLMIITSHINLHFTIPPIRNTDDREDKSKHFYSKKLINFAEGIALKHNINVRKGVYASVQGPSLETKSEYRVMKTIGADVVGMSTIPEVILAKKLGIESLGLSIITDEGFPDTVEVAKLENILKAASIAEPKLTKLTQKFIEEIKI